ncbi:heme A synthase [Catenuloplanes sp. NPDC051500]|uniref:heme A synthase n=1 Tax=Catenuloplanes sp. NPDC051500 TaxID=3363959 RepID=UPI0037AC649C
MDGWLRGLGLASIVANVGIVVTGGAVRLTKSGLGCPTWPRCTDASYTTTPEMGVHGVIEFGNRLLTFVVIAIAVAALIAAVLERPRRRPLVVLALVTLIGLPMQGVIGGITVLTNLNPWVVGLHFLGSIFVITTAYQFYRRVVDAPLTTAPPVLLRRLAWVITGVSLAVVVVGVIVTNAGPHSGDGGVKRNHLDPELITQLHVDLVMLLIGLSVAYWFAARLTGAQTRPALILIAVELSQSLIGFVQHFTHLPVILVGLHMLGACLVWIATLHVLHSTRTPEQIKI